MIPNDKRLYTKHMRAFLRAIQPDVVHFQHTMFFGYDILRATRNALPTRAENPLACPTACAADTSERTPLRRTDCDGRLCTASAIAPGRK